MRSLLPVIVGSVLLVTLWAGGTTWKGATISGAEWMRASMHVGTDAVVERETLSRLTLLELAARERAAWPRGLSDEQTLVVRERSSAADPFRVSEVSGQRAAELDPSVTTLWPGESHHMLVSDERLLLITGLQLSPTLQLVLVSDIGQQLAESLGRLGGCEATVSDFSGNVYGSTWKDVEGNRIAVAPPEEVIAAVLDDAGEVARGAPAEVVAGRGVLQVPSYRGYVVPGSPTNGRLVFHEGDSSLGSFYAFRPLVRDGELVALLGLSAPEDIILGFPRLSILGSSALGLLLVLLSVWTIFRVTHSHLAPVERLAGAIRGLSARIEGDSPLAESLSLPPVAVESRSPGDLGELVAALLELQERVLSTQELRSSARHSGELLRRITDNAPALISYVTQDLRYRFANQRYADWMGLVPLDMIGQTVAENLGVDFTADIRGKMERALRGEEQHFELELLGSHAEGGASDADSQKPRHLVTSYLPDLDPDGNVRGFMAIAYDITPRVEAERMKTRVQQRYKTLVEDTSDLIETVTDSGGLSFVNPAWLATLGYSIEEALGLSAKDIVAEASYDDFLRLLEGPSAIGLPTAIELSLLRKDGAEVVVEGSRGILSEQDEGVSLFLRDITARKKADAARLELERVQLTVRAKTEYADELSNALERERELGELKTRFISMASHEFRTPLSYILVAADLLLMHSDRLTREQRETRLHRIREHVEQMTRLLDDVLEIGRSESSRLGFRPEPTNLPALVREVLDELRALDRGRHTMRLETVDVLPSIAVDRERTRRLVRNLVSNGLKYSEDGGAVHVSLRAVDEELELVVLDEGRGIPQADMASLFEPFVRGANVGDVGGSGLGLAIVQQVVEIHGGTIGVESKLGEGASFTVRLPLESPGGLVSIETATVRDEPVGGA